MEQQHYDQLIWKGSLLLLILLSIALLAAPGIYIDTYLQDLFVVMDAVWRAQSGDLAHVHFRTPVGQVFLWPYILLGQFGDPSTKMILCANLLIAGLSTILAFIALRRRMTSEALALLCLLIFTASLSPRQIGTWDGFSHLAPYNRWGWSMTAIVAGLAFVPFALGARRVSSGPYEIWISSLILGLVLALLFHLKLTYFLVGFGFLVAGVVLGVASVYMTVGAISALLISLGTVEFFAGNTLAYLSDLQMAALSAKDDTTGGVLRLGKLARHLVEGSLYGLLLCMIVWLRDMPRTVVEFVRQSWKEIGIGATIILGGVALSLQNHPTYESPLFLVALLIAYARTQGRLVSRHVFMNVSSAQLRAGLLALVVGATLLLDVTSVIRHLAMSHSAQAHRIPAFEGTAFADLRVPKSIYETSLQAAPESTWRPQYTWRPLEPAFWSVRVPYYVRRTTEALSLIERHATMADRVLPFEFANPYAALTKTAPVRESLLWWHHGRSYSLTSHPDPDLLLGDVSLVLVTKANPFSDESSFMWSLYGESVANNFSLIESTPQWHLWRRLQPVPAN